MKHARPAAFLLLLAAWSMPASAGSEPAATMDAAPQWLAGDWWQVRFQPDMGPVSTHRLIVAGSDKGEYLVGQPDTAGRVPLLIYHAPYFGRVAAADLSYSVHNQRFHPLQFPLTEGRSWHTQFNDLPIDAKVTAVDGVTAKIEYRSSAGIVGGAVYDAAARTLTKFNLAGHGSIQVVESGRGYACDVEYPDRYELLFLDYTAGTNVPTAEADMSSDGLKAFRTQEIDRPFGQAALALIVGGEKGLFSQQVIPPDNIVHEATVQPADRERWRAIFVEIDDPMGTWRLNSAATGGMGQALAEAIGFDSRTAHLADVVPADQQGTTGECAASSAVTVDGTPLALIPDENDYSAALLGTGLVLTAGLGAFVVALRRPWWPLLLLFAKIPPERVLDHRVRHDVHDLLKQQPGLTTQEIRRHLGLGWGNTVHHLAILERAGIVAGTRWGHNRNWFLRDDTPPASRNAISALRRDAARKVFERIQATPGISQEDLARDLSLHHSTVIFHVDRLMLAELISKKRDGQRVRYYPGASGST